jgi:murein DD-endopeptidase MepM/ murein hydrolase activator NlpD
MDCLSYNETTRDWRTHNGIDIAAEAGTPVCAAADGVVYTTYTDEVMGTTVVVRHGGGYVTTYSSMDGKLEVSAGDTVTLGQTLGYVGSSAVLETAVGDHVHFGVTLNDTPVDPADFLKLG